MKNKCIDSSIQNGADITKPPDKNGGLNGATRQKNEFLKPLNQQGILDQNNQSTLNRQIIIIIIVIMKSNDKIKKTKKI